MGRFDASGVPQAGIESDVPSGWATPVPGGASESDLYADPVGFDANERGDPPTTVKTSPVS
jgi:hypothetical protein